MYLPPGPRLPSLAQTAAMIAQPTSFFDRCLQRYGDAFTLRVLGPKSPPVVFFSQPEAVQAIFTTLAPHLELGRVTHVFRPLVGSESMIMQEGDRHRQQRHLLMPALHGEHLDSYGQLIRAIATQGIAAWALGQTVSFRPWMAHISLDIIMRVVFGLQPSPRYRALRALLDELLEAITDPLYSVQFFLPPLQQDWGTWSPWGRFVRRRAQIDAILFAEIQDKRQSQKNGAAATDGTSVLDLLLAVRDDAGQPLGDQELRDQLMTLLLLGHETTASALTWALYWIHREGGMRDRLVAELSALGDDADPTAINQIPYLNAVCQEALRLYPIALIAQPRRVRSPIELAGYEFPSGSVLVPCIYTAHRRPDVYPEPLAFRPERFLERKISPYEYFPFGGGSRRCIGMALALYEMKLVLATVLTQVRLSLVHPDQPVYPFRRGITFVPPARLAQAKVEERRSPPAIANLAAGQAGG
ncbi:MAG: cytochrome P450 [Synechococcales bacterium]|nr:cytochrome P450 [Synechococcales bacterium]